MTLDMYTCMYVYSNQVWFSLCTSIRINIRQTLLDIPLGVHIYLYTVTASIITLRILEEEEYLL